MLNIISPLLLSSVCNIFPFPCTIIHRVVFGNLTVVAQIICNFENDFFELCRAMDAGYEYNEFHEIRTQKDIEDLECASGSFHDALIIKEELQDDYVDSDEVEGITEGKIKAECCYFRARHLRYRIIPD